MATDRQQRTYDTVREHHALTVSRVQRLNSVLSDAHCTRFHKFAVGGCVWVDNTADTTHQSAKTDMDVKVLKVKLPLN